MRPLFLCLMLSLKWLGHAWIMKRWVWNAESKDKPVPARISQNPQEKLDPRWALHHFQVSKIKAVMICWRSCYLLKSTSFRTREADWGIWQVWHYCKPCYCPTSISETADNNNLHEQQQYLVPSTDLLRIKRIHGSSCFTSPFQIPYYCLSQLSLTQN